VSRLHYKLSLGILIILLSAGGTFYLIERHSMRLYYEELTQRLNASLAMYIVNSEALIDAGSVNGDALKTLASRAMVINPTAEIYLLDPAGRILGHALPPEKVLADRVDTGPIRTLLDGTSPLPIKGHDPRDRESALERLRTAETPARLQSTALPNSSPAESGSGTLEPQFRQKLRRMDVEE
jgi:hypothetical protein